MPILSSILFCISLVFAVLFGAQTRPWSWGPALLFLALALATTIPTIIRSSRVIQPWFLLLSITTAAWYLFRAWISPVHELAVADILLTISAIGSFIVVRTFSTDRKSESIFLWTITILALSSAFVILKQDQDPSFTPIFGERPVTLPSGFFGHYNDGANFLIAISFLLASASLFGNASKATRLIWGTAAIVGLIAIYFTRSRGAILATGVATATFCIIVLLLGKTRGQRWFAPAIIIAPILTLIAFGFVYFGWSHAQEFRFQADIDKLMDGNIRLFLYGISISCIAIHPWLGGGSRSFSWEGNQFWINQDHGQGSHSLEYVHNELLQAASDYGLVGAILLVLTIFWAFWLFVIYSCSSNIDANSKTSDAIRAGAAAALIGMLLQSSFSFVFHLLPGPVLLGICLARITLLDSPAGRAKFNNANKVSLVTISAFSCALAFFFGWKGIQVSSSVWPAFFKKGADNSQRLSALSKGISLWPQASLYKERGLLLHRSIGNPSVASAASDQVIVDAIHDYSKAAELHPYEPIAIINLANLLSLVGRDEEAELRFRRAIYLQGGMEIGYRAQLLLGEHYVRKGRRLLEATADEEALETYQLALKQLESIERETPWVINEPRGTALRLSAFSGLGTTYERLGDLEMALSYFDKASSILGGSNSHYRAGLIIGTQAKAAWSERRPSEALSRFQEARQRIALATELPAGVTPEMKAEYLAFLDRSIQYLVEAKVEPLKKPEE